MIARSNRKVKHLKRQPKRPYKCEMCADVKNIKPYEMKLISFTGLEDITMIVCRKCAYRETFGTKGMVGAMRENLIEQEETN